MKIKLSILDDHKIMTEGLKHLLSLEHDFDILPCFSKVEDLLQWLDTNTCDILLLDVYLQDGNGLEVCAKLSIDHPEIRIIAISGQNEALVISKMLQNGAKGYVLKNADSDEIIEAIHQVYSGETYLCRRTQEALKKANNQISEIPKITRREKEVLILIAEGLTTNEIAGKLFISSHTVESHRKNLIEKFDAKSTTSVISIVKNLGLI